jgi:hypothetical protein
MHLHPVGHLALIISLLTRQTLFASSRSSVPQIFILGIYFDHWGMPQILEIHSIVVIKVYSGALIGHLLEDIHVRLRADEVNTLVDSRVSLLWPFFIGDDRADLSFEFMHVACF